jgi:hypothetical protein
MRRKKSRYLEVVPPSEVFGADHYDVGTDAPWPELGAVGREPASSQDFGLWRLAEASDRLTRWRPVLVKPHSRTDPSPDRPTPDWPDAA